MNDFAKKGPNCGGDGVAALAIVRALIKTLEKSGKLIPKDIIEIIDDALMQLPNENIDRINEARRLIENLS